MIRFVAFALSLVWVAAALPAAPATTAAAEHQAPVIAVFDLDGPITESPSQDFVLFAPKPVSLRELVQRMRDAGDDDNIKAVVVQSSEGMMAGAAQVEEIREAIAYVRKQGKDVFAHSDSMRMGQYLLLSGATRISVVPTADLWVNGIRAEQPYLRGLLDKIGVHPDFLHIGAYKSAGELFTREGPSPEAEAMMNWLVDSLYSTFVDLIAEGRHVSADQVRKWIDAGPYNADQAKEAGLIDAIEHRQDFDAMLKKKYGENLTYERRYGREHEPQLDFSSPFAIFKFWGELLGAGQREASNKPIVGVVYVDGIIIPGRKNGFPFFSAATSSDIRKALDEAAREDKVKAVVLRVDSPGGSAVASEIILDAARRVKEKKPLVVSMGNLAASGGYYVSCAADTVFADRTTITASIGVVAGKLITTDMWGKIGIKFKAYQRGENADLFASHSPWTDAQRQKMQSWMDAVYATFQKHVTDARGDKLKKPLDDIAGGRVYTGQQALELGLVDKIGTLGDAIRFAADKASVSDYDVRVIPRPKNFIEKIMEESSGADEDNRWIASASLANLAMPYLNGLDRQRVAAIRSALERLQLFSVENVLLVTPQTFIFN